MSYKVCIIAGLIFLILTCFALAEEKGRQDFLQPEEAPLRSDSAGRVVIQRVISPIKLDGLIDEPAWEGLEPLPHIEHGPNFGKEPSERTVEAGSTTKHPHPPGWVFLPPTKKRLQLPSLSSTYIL